VCDLTHLTSLSRGARFYRADMHIHSFGPRTGSHDVKDSTMTPEAIVQTAIAEKLDIIAITDHNEIGNVEAAIAAAGTDLLVVPGVELSTPQGHLLCYLPDLEALRGFYSRLRIADRGTANSRCQQALLECLTAAREFRGFGVLAHVDAPKGYETEMPGNSPHKVDVLCHPALLGIELKSAASEVAYSDQDPVPSRAAIGLERVRRLGLGAKQFLARVIFSDAHSLTALGRNAEGDKKVTRIKMDIPSFDALRLAFDDADARIRIEERIPYSVPYVLGVHMDGGFLDQQAIHFSRNLNCIVGGRGTGKSTTFEAIRRLSGDDSNNDVIDSEVWPSGLALFWQDASGQQHSLFRASQDQVCNLDDPDFGPTQFAIDCYGQGETAKISQQAHTNPYVLIQYLDKFIDKDAAAADEEAAKAKLLEIQGKMERAELKVAQIPQYEKALQTTKLQLSTLEKANAKEIIGLQRKLAQEKQIRVQIDATLTDLKTKISQSATKGAIAGLRQLATPSDLRVGQIEFQNILQFATNLDSSAQTAETQIRNSVTEFGEKVAAQLKSWRAKDVQAQQTIEAKKKELEAQGIRLDMAYIQKLAQEEASYAKELGELKILKAELAELKRQRIVLLKARWAARDKIATIRDAYSRKASAALLESLHDIKVSLKYIRNAYAPDAARQIQDVMGWRTIQVQRAQILIESLTVPRLLEAIEKNDIGPLTALKVDGVRLFPPAEAAEIIKRLAQPAVKFALERCTVEDLPKLTITKNTSNDPDKPNYVSRDFSRLSLGQQQSILLTLMLCSDERTSPLLIDQPEDNLDGEFIYSSLVPVLRRAKERRQIIIVTHNANIAILGDAEQIVVLKGTNEGSKIVARGSIDDAATCTTACNVLEGAREAFQRRAKIYGFHIEMSSASRPAAAPDR
jgi:AAA domain, putative AbiEii toxin, Type IV TA system